MGNELLALFAKRLSDLGKRFETLSKQEGPPGKDGINGVDGRPGRDGKDGKDGKDGRPGRDGKDGKDGKPGPQGEKGEKGDTGSAPAHQWDGTKLRFKRPDGQWGKTVDLKGEGGVAFVGGGRWSPDVLPLATDVVPDEIIVKQSGVWVRATWGQFRDWIAIGAAVTVNGDIVTVNGDAVTVNGA